MIPSSPRRTKHSAWMAAVMLIPLVLGLQQSLRTELPAPHSAIAGHGVTAGLA